MRNTALWIQWLALGALILCGACSKKLPPIEALAGQPASGGMGPGDGGTSGTGGTDGSSGAGGGTSGTDGSSGAGGAPPMDSGMDSGADAEVADAGTDAGNPVAACAPGSCNGHGTCADTVQGPVCTCDEGFSDAVCSTRSAEYGRRLKVIENLAHPDVIKFSDDRYVLSGTRDAALELPFYESTDLITWNDAGSYSPSSADPNYDYCFVWAPDLVQIDGTLYLYFSAHRGGNGNTNCPPPPSSDVTTYRATSPDGSLNFGAPALLYQSGSAAKSRTQSGCPAGGCGLAIRIAPTAFQDRLYYVFFNTINSGNNIGSVSLADGSGFIHHAGPAAGTWALASYEESINEAPEVLQRAGRYYLFFSTARYNSQSAIFYVMADSTAELTRDRTIHRLTTPVRSSDNDLLENHAHNSVTTRRGETFNIFHQGVFGSGGVLIRRDVYRQRIAWNDDGTAISQNRVHLSWNSLGGGNRYSLHLVLRDGEVIGPCIAATRINQNTEIDYLGVCPNDGDRLIHKSEVAAFRLFASPTTTGFMQVGETAYDGYSDLVNIVATP